MYTRPALHQLLLFCFLRLLSLATTKPCFFVVKPNFSSEAKMERKKLRSSTSTAASTAVISILLLFANIPGLSLSSDYPPPSTGRKLMQTPQGCPVNFEYANYTILTSRCKGPLYPPDQCCAAFKDFACPYADEINNLNNECASTMFSYINLNGKYPPGLFASECREGKQGLECPASPTLSNRANGIHMAQDKLWLLLFPACFWAVILLLY